MRVTAPLVRAAVPVLVLAAVAAPRVIPAQAPAAVDTVTIDSRATARARRVFVRVPASHSATTRSYPVLLVLDGEYLFGTADTIAAKLASIGHVPEAIVVGIENPVRDPRARVYDMTPPGMSVAGSDRDQGGDRFLDFLEREVLPMLRQRYRAGAPVVLLGHSSGALIATWAAATRPAAFQAVVALDAPVQLGEGHVAKRLRARPKEGPPLRYVSIEAQYGWDEGDWASLRAAAPSAWVLQRERLRGESHNSMPFVGIYLGLRDAFPDWSVVGAPLVPRATAGAAFAHYRRLEEQLGGTLPPPRRALETMVEDLLTEGRVDDARRALAWMTEGYGNAAERVELERMIARVAARPPLRETVETLRAAPAPTPAEIAPYVGRWTGHHWLHPDARSPSELHISVADGKIVAEVIQRPAQGVELRRPVEYLKVVPGGLEFGYMNGMRPLGMIVSAGRRTGDVLEGTSTFRGIVVPLPDGHVPPAIHFRYRKQ